MQTSDAKTDHEILTPLERGLELLIIPAMLCLLGFFAYHQVSQTGFFTEKFGPLEQIALYGPILVSGIAPVVISASGRHNPGRPFEALTNLTMGLGAIWLLIVFPFDFPHLGDILPNGIRFILSWMTNDIGWAVLIIQAIAGPISALATLIKYLLVRSREPVSPPRLRTS